MNASWRERVLRDFTPGVARLTLVADPDGILLEEELTQTLRGQGFAVMLYDDPLAFRYAFESNIRARWDQGEQSELIVIVPNDGPPLHEMPYDLTESSHKVTLGLNDLFPGVSYPVIASLDASDLPILWQAVVQFQPANLGDVATVDFALRHVFGIATEVIKQPADLLRILLRRHYSLQRVPSLLDEHLIAKLHSNPLFQDWPLAQVVPDREAFLAFLQERWPGFLNRLASEKVAVVEEPSLGYGLQLAGPPDLPFGHDDVRVYIDNLFLEGYLRPVPVTDAKKILSTWATVGVQSDLAADRQRRLTRLAEKVESSIPDSEAKHADWLTFAHRWAELTALAIGGSLDGQPNHVAVWQRLCPQVDQAFAAWLNQRYAGLHSQPSTPPVMVHHIARAMARHHQDAPGSRLALLVLDGLALSQWHVVRTALDAQQQGLVMRDSAVFAWIPTLTPVSRQAIFAGKSPYYFGDTIFRTDKEPQLWERFWLDAGVSKSAVAYRKGRDLDDGQALRDWISQPHLRVLGLVIDIVDNIMHGMELGMAGMHNQVRQWAQSGYLGTLISYLHAAGYTVWLTADHGNVEARGAGQPSEGTIADIRGARARIYPTASLRSQIHQKYPGAIKWTPVGLPANFYPLLASERTAFAPVGQQVVTHGGATLEEVIVPFVEIEARPA